MAVFPKIKGNILKLAKDIMAGLKANASIFPSPPFIHTALQTLLDTVDTKRDNRVRLEGELRQAVEEENAAIASLRNAMKSDISYAEAIATEKKDPSILERIGWHARKEKENTTPPEPPGALTISKLDASRILLSWKGSSTKGSRAKFYKVELRQKQEDLWQDAASTTKKEIMLINQPSGLLEYRIIGSNNAGDGPASNSAFVMI